MTNIDVMLFRADAVIALLGTTTRDPARQQ
jgi:hypothetical protein